MPSIMFRPSTYPDCSGEMSPGRRGFRRLAITFEITLYITKSVFIFKMVIRPALFYGSPRELYKSLSIKR